MANDLTIKERLDRIEAAIYLRCSKQTSVAEVVAAMDRTIPPVVDKNAESGSADSVRCQSPVG